MASLKRTDIITGAILEIPLEKEYGYGYVKLIFSKDVQPNYEDYPIIKVYNVFRKKSLERESFNSLMFETDELVMYPLLMWGFPNIKGSHKWILKGFSKLTENDKIIPDYLKTNPNKKFCASTIKEEVNQEHGCLLIRNFEMIPIKIRDYQSIKYIGQWSHFSPKGIRRLVTMFWMNKNGQSIKEHYTKGEFENDDWLGYFYNKIMDSDINYTELYFKNYLKAVIEE